MQKEKQKLIRLVAVENLPRTKRDDILIITNKGHEVTKIDDNVKEMF